MFVVVVQGKRGRNAEEWPPHPPAAPASKPDLKPAVADLEDFDGYLGPQDLDGRRVGARPGVKPDATADGDSADATNRRLEAARRVDLPDAPIREPAHELPA